MNPEEDQVDIDLLERRLRQPGGRLDPTPSDEPPDPQMQDVELLLRLYRNTKLRLEDEQSMNKAERVRLRKALEEVTEQLKAIAAALPPE